MKLCDGYEALRAQLGEAEAGFQHQLAEALRLEDERVRWANISGGWILAMQEMEADLRALAEAIIEYRMAQNPHNMDFPEMQPVTNALYRPGVQRLIAKDVTAGSY